MKQNGSFYADFANLIVQIYKLLFSMVCSLGGSGRMAVMARVLAAGSYSQNMAEEVGHLKLAAQYICRELREADEANLLDEEGHFQRHLNGHLWMAAPHRLKWCLWTERNNWSFEDRKNYA
ncbi:uncharacterized protein LOC136061358 isoform X2 [Quercus suber]|uniref:uncharacterized protein LOC136061358 isoform X2 n=1 Tax=Quercus suber TaxID=58331 RepID=UPI0032DECCF3